MYRFPCATFAIEYFNCPAGVLDTIGNWSSHSTYMICTDKEFAIILTDILKIDIIHVDQRDRQCTCNATLSRVRATIVAVEEQGNKCYIFRQCMFVALRTQRHLLVRHIVS
jgi:hypothetical protein